MRLPRRKKPARNNKIKNLMVYILKRWGKISLIMGSPDKRSYG
jgi:hypothetical protein